MNGSVTKLYDIDSIEIPAQLLEVHVDEAAVEAQLNQLPLRYAEEHEAENAEMGDVVRCKSDAYPDGRAILLYTATTLPGAEEAAHAALGKRAGDTFSALLAGKTVAMTVEKVLRRVPVEVNDALIASLGIEGVTTVDGYRAYLREKNLADQQMEQSKAVVRFVMDKMVENSVYSYDEAEMEDYIAKSMGEYRAQTEEMAPEMEEVPEEEMRDGILYQVKQSWMAEAFCQKIGQEPDMTQIEAEADQMMEMMSLMGEQTESREEMIEMSRQNACLDAFFAYVDQMIEKKMGGNHGNN